MLDYFNVALFSFHYYDDAIVVVALINVTLSAVALFNVALC